MKTRVDAGTDVAMIGAWDASRNDSVLPRRWGKQFDETLERDAADGQLFLIDIGGDGGGPIDIYVDEEVPEEVRKGTRRAEGGFLIAVPTGRMVVGGVEDHRSNKPQITAENSVVTVPCGDYLLRCYVGAEEEGGFDLPTDAQLEKAIGVDDYNYHRKLERRGCLGYLTLLLFPLLAFPFGWKIALAVTVIIVAAYFNVQERIVLKRNVRYQRIARAVGEVWRKAEQREPAMLIFELRRVEQRTGLKGGSLQL